MTRVLIWDLPTRLLHWLMTVGFCLAFGIAQFAGEHSRWFDVHMIVGLALGVVVLLRIVWGIVGSRYACFKSFVYSPVELMEYLHGAVRKTAPRYAGHNPGSAYATFAILALLCVLIGSGLLMSTGSEAAEEIHEPAVYALAAMVVIHIAGVAWHSWRHRENLTATMISGQKWANNEDAIWSSRPVAAAVFAVAVAAVTIGLYRNYDAKRHETALPFVGTTIHLGEGDEH
jgi:cytochrome b